MQSVLRPSQSPAERGSETVASAGKPNQVRHRSSWQRNFAAVLFSTVGLWLIAGVAWCHIQWWQQSDQDAARSQDMPAHRISMDDQPLQR